MTCKDCIYYDKCKEVFLTDKICWADGCKDFKNKADYVEVVRCKDCKCYLAVTYNGNPMHYGYCKNKHDDILGNRHRYEGDYCSYGESK
jgi:hypothetical protein